jgi:uncharacterized phage infection (PIP) family protein YhgE
VADAGRTMQEIVSSVQRVTDIIGEITAASSEQSDGIGQINGSVSQLDQMTQQNAALVEQSAAAAESLKAQAEQLVEAVSVFRVGGDAARGESGRRGSELAETQAKVIRPVASKAAFTRAGAPALQGSPAFAGDADGWGAF